MDVVFILPSLPFHGVFRFVARLHWSGVTSPRRNTPENGPDPLAGDEDTIGTSDRRVREQVFPFASGSRHSVRCNMEYISSWHQLSYPGNRLYPSSRQVTGGKFLNRGEKKIVIDQQPMGNIRAVYTRENKPQITEYAAYESRELSHLYGHSLSKELVRGLRKPRTSSSYRLYEQFAAYISRGLCNPRFIFPRINGPIKLFWTLTLLRSELLLWLIYIWQTVTDQKLEKGMAKANRTKIPEHV